MLILNNLCIYNITMPKQKMKNMKGGDCGCQMKSLMSDQVPNSLFKGGAVEFDTDHKYTYPLNTHGGDPTNPDMVMSVRMQPNMITGGKKKNNKKKQTQKKRVMKSKPKRQIKKRYSLKKGGSQILDTHNANVVSSFFDVGGTPNSVHVITGIKSPLLNSLPDLNTQKPFI